MTIYNVMNYGATGNGVTNDTAAIQAAINAAHAAGGGEVYIPAGTYIVSGDGNPTDGCLTLYSNITVTGAGQGATTVQLQNGSDQAITGIFRDQYGIANNNITLEDLTINGNSANTTGKVDGWFNGVFPEKNNPLNPNEPYDSNITINDVTAENCSGYGFDPHEKTENLVISNSTSHNNGLDGFTLDGQYNATLTNDVAYDNARNGFNIVTSSNNVTLNGDTAYGNGEDGVIVQRGSDNVPVPENITIKGGDFYSNTDNGVEILMANTVTVNGADIHNNGERGVRIEGSTGSVIENSTLHDDSQAGNYKYAEISLEVENDTAGVSGLIYPTTGTLITNNAITDDGAVRAGMSVEEFDDGSNDTTVSNNVIYGTGDDEASLSASNSTFTPPPLTSGTTNSNAPTILYAPLLGQSNAEEMSITAPDGSSGLGQIYNGLSQLGYSQVVTMTNMAVGGSTVNGDENTTVTAWWYPTENKPGPDLLNAVAQMKEQISELSVNGIVTPMVIWAQGEAEANDIGKITTAAGREAAEAQYINETLAVFDYLKANVNPNIQFYIMETGRLNLTGADNAGFTTTEINQINLGLTYVDDAQIKMGLAFNDIHLAVNYSDLPMDADMPASTPGYEADWATDTWHISPASKEIAAQRATGYIALNVGESHILESPGPYPTQALANLTLQSGSGVTVNDAGDTNNAIITDTTGSGSTLTGGKGSDIFVVGGVNDKITDGSGSDTIYFSPAELQQVKAYEAGTLTNIHDTITGFKTGASGDVINVSALLMADGYTGSNAVADGYIQVVSSSSGAEIEFDPDGSAGNEKAVTLAVLSGVAASAFNMTDNLVTQFPYGNPITIDTSTDTASVIPGGSPVAETDDFTGEENEVITGNLMANNGNGAASDPSGLALSVVATTLTTAHGASVVENANGTFTYTPATGFTGTDSFTYTLEDSAGLKATGTADVTVSLIPEAVVQALNGITPAPTLINTTSDSVLKGVSGIDNVILDHAGNDTIFGRNENDVLIGGTGDDYIYAGTGNDVLYSGAGDNKLYASTGNDILISGSGENDMTAGTGQDVFVFSELKVSGAHDDIHNFNTSEDKLNISALLGSTGTAHLATTTAGYTGLYITPAGSTQSTLLISFEGTTNISTSTSLQSILTTVSANTDPVYAPPVAETDIFTGQENQVITGNLTANNGNGAASDPNGLALSVEATTLTTAHGASVVENADGTFTYTPATGFTGTDSFTYTLEDSAGLTATGTADVTVSLIPEPVIQALNGVTPTPTLVNTTSDSVLKGVSGTNNVILDQAGNDTIHGGSENDVLIGGTGGDYIYAGTGNDVLYSGTGDNKLYASTGKDTLISASGENTMTAGTGNDDFVFEPKTLNAHDVITGFNTSEDKLDISALLGSTGTAHLATTSSGYTGLYITPEGTTHSTLLVDFQGTTNITTATPLNDILT